MENSTKLCAIMGSFATTCSTFLLLKRITAFKSPTAHHWVFIRKWYMLFHVLVSATLTTISVFVLDKIDDKNTFLEDLVASIGIGHFMFDFVFVSYLVPDTMILLHHIFLFLWFSASLIYNLGGELICNGVFIVYISDIWLHLRALISFLNQKYTGLFFLVEFLYFATFYAGNLVFGPFLTAKILWFREHNEWLIVAGFYGIYAQKIYYCWNLRTLVAKRFNEFEHLRKKAQIPWINPVRFAIPINN